MSGALPELSAAQNSDGGWPYRGGGSWTEPTVYVLLALTSAGELSSPAAAKALDWLSANQRPDGGWAPRPSVQESTWVTALVLLLPAAMRSRFNAAAALNWLLLKTGRESSWVERLRSTFITGQVTQMRPEGWPWFPDTAAWVAPTAFAILALRKARQRDPRDEIRDRIERGREFLMSRVCADGGWNHGSTRALGYDGPSYPETTGLALLALDGLPETRIARSLERAEQHLRNSQSLEATSWLQLGLGAHARRTTTEAGYSQRSFSTPEIALRAIAQQASRGGDVFRD